MERNRNLEIDQIHIGIEYMMEVTSLNQYGKIGYSINTVGTTGEKIKSILYLTLR